VYGKVLKDYGIRMSRISQEDEAFVRDVKMYTQFLLETSQLAAECRPILEENGVW